MDLPPPPPPPSRPPTVDDNMNLRNFLIEFDWPRGLQNAFVAGTINTPARFMICDDSGSMMTNDGHRAIGPLDNQKYEIMKYKACMFETIEYSSMTSSFCSHQNCELHALGRNDRDTRISRATSTQSSCSDRISIFEW